MMKKDEKEEIEEKKKKKKMWEVGCVCVRETAKGG